MWLSVEVFPGKIRGGNYKKESGLKGSKGRESQVEEEERRLLRQTQHSVCEEG